MQNRQANNFAILITNHDVVIGDLAVASVAGFFETDVEHIGFGIVGRPEIIAGRAPHRWHDFQELSNLGYGHSCFLRSSVRLARSSPPVPATIRSGSAIASKTSKR